MSIKESVYSRLDTIDENAVINLVANLVPRSTASVNNTHESDSEIVDVGLDSHYLAATTDLVSEEISAGLYTDPFLMGWMAVVVNLSDLAAVGAQPLGLLLNTTVSEEWDNDTFEAVVQGIAEACTVHGCGSLGGDLNTGEPALGATALGLVEKDRVMKRTGMGHNDVLYVSGPVGMGGAYAFAKLAMPHEVDRFPYQPVARLKEARVISKYASSCMDTSDGLLFTLDQLFRLNSASLCIDSLEKILHPGARELTEMIQQPPLTVLAAIHGEFELCFTIPQEQESAFIKEMDENGFAPLRAGSVLLDGFEETVPEPGVYIDGKELPTGKIRNLWSGSVSTMDYIKSVLEIISDFYG
ncbi:MAG: hypothetical protein GY754_04555 [bacterium]|nr:hypothetical protein [bacterium]